MIDIKNGDCLELMPHIPPPVGRYDSMWLDQK